MTANGKPEFIDNRNNNTLEIALNNVLLANSECPLALLRIATAYFNPGGFFKIADRLENVADVRLLLGSDLFGRTIDEKRKLGETETDFEKRRLNQGLKSMQNSLCLERDRLPFDRKSYSAMKKLVAALKSDNLEVRRYEKAFLHAKAYIFSSSNDDKYTTNLIAGSSNLTSAGLSKNLELNLGNYDASVGEKAVNWFDELWEEANEFDLSEIFEGAFQCLTPWEIFIRVLWQYYGSEFEEELHDKNLPLTSFQKHGVARALRLIRELGGAIVADEVGLGKTFIAGEILEIYLKRRQRALIICPASLIDTTWEKFLSRFRLYAESISFEKLAKEVQLNGASNFLQRNLDEYQLIIVDEAHNYRNPNAPTRAGVLRSLLSGQRRDLLLMTATPVNNSLWDLYNLIQFFVRQDAEFANKGILSIRKRFEEAMSNDPTSLNPDLLYPIIDATTVKRTRQFIKKHYYNDNIEDAEGNPVPIKFPTPVAKTVKYKLDELLPKFFDHLEDALDPESGNRIAFARYNPNKFLIDKSDDDEIKRNRSVVGLLRSGMLKRFESSAFAFKMTTSKMIDHHKRFLEALEKGFVINTQFLQELSGDDDTVFEEMLPDNEHSKPSEDYRIDDLKNAVERDLKKLKSLHCETVKVEKELDPKLAALSNTLREIVLKSDKISIDKEDARQRRKVLVFSYYKDTVNWIYEYITSIVDQDKVLNVYKNRIAYVSGSDDNEEGDRTKPVEGFAPISMEVPDGTDRYDLLIATDVIAEGVNLQQCQNIINFDMPWNPMRLVQRHGRIDRIGSKYKEVYLHTIFPSDRLDRLLNLENKIIGKLAMAAASIGVVPPIEGASEGKQVFTETRQEIEKLLREDSSIYERGATESAAQTGEEYRQTLRKALEENRDAVVDLPWKIGSGMMRGKYRGVFFCAVVGDTPFVRFISADEDWKPNKLEKPIKELGTCLRMIECEKETPLWMPDFMKDTVFDFWDSAQKDIFQEWDYRTDPRNIQPQLRPLNHKVAEFLRKHSGSDIDSELRNKALDILESPWPRREEIKLRSWFEKEEFEGEFAKHASFIIDKIINSGLKPTESPKPFPPINDEDIQLLCWMALTPETEPQDKQ